MNLPADLSYDNPWAVWILFAVLLVLFLTAIIFRYRKRMHSAFNPERLLPRSRTLFWGKGIAFALAWIFATLALMGPKGNGHYPEEGTSSKKEQQEGVVKRKAHDVVIAIDASASMGIKDSRNGMSRLDYAKQIADQLISRLQGDSVALYAFTYEPALLSPATLDTLYVRLLLRSLRINEGDTAGTSLTHMLEAFQKKFLARPSQKLITFVLLSDGEDNQLKSVNDLQQYIQGPSLLQTQMFTIGMGSEEGGQVPDFSAQSRLVPLPLQFIAQVGRGNYFEANRFTPIALIDALLEEMDKVNPFVQPGEIPASFLTGEDNLIYDLYFQIPLAIALVFLAFYLLGPNTWKRTSLVLVFLPLALTGVEIKQVKEAQDRIEAGLYREGEGIYQQLLTQPLKTWEEATLTYDWGTAELLRGDPRKGLDIFEKLPLSSNPYPLLLKNLWTNRAVAFYLLALKEPLKEANAYEEALYNLGEASAYFRLAKGAHCELVKLEGGKLCNIPEDLMQLGHAIKLNRAHLMQAYITLRIDQMSQAERLPLLYAQLEELQEALELLKDNPNYRQLTLNQLERWRVVWDKLPADSAARPLFDELIVKIGRGGQVEVTLAALEKELQKEMESLFQNDQGVAKSHLLQGLYQFALLQDPPSRIALKALETVEGVENQELLAAIAAQEKGEGELSRFYLLAAQKENPLPGESVKEVLVRAIDAEARALRLNRFLNRIPSPHDPSLQAIARKAQEKAIEAGAPFLARAYDAQMDRFNDEKRSLEQRCQAEPWNEVVALYSKGREHAVKGLELSLNEQGQALAYWKEALLHLDKEGGGKGCPSGGASAEEIKNIQEMDQDDRIEKKTNALKVEGVNPW